MQQQIPEPKPSAAIQHLTLSCTECNLKLRIGRFIERPILMRNGLQYCPSCKSPATIEIDREEDFWEDLAQHYGITVEALKAIYSVWDMHETPVFRDFVVEMLKEALGK